MRTVRDIIRSWALAATIFVIGVAWLSSQRARTDQKLADEGQTAVATITGHEDARDNCRFALYRFTTGDGKTFEGRDGCLHDDEKGPSIVTYLPTQPEVHRPGDLRGHNAWMDVAVMVAASVVAAVALLVLALAVRMGVDRWIRRK